MGLLIVLISSIVRMIIDNNYNLSILYSSSSIGMLTGGLLGGLLISFTQWELNEHKYNKSNEEKI
jgi:MFS family permease